MTTTEKIWTGDASMLYPKQWIVMVDLEYDRETHKVMGHVHTTTSDRTEAYDIAIALKGVMGRTTVVEGFDDTLRLGDAMRWGL